jgi:hypothetical protein
VRSSCLVWILPLAAAAGCTVAFDIDQAVEQQALVGLGYDVPESCAEPVTLAPDARTTLDCQPLSAGLCSCDLQWSGVLLDAETLRDGIGDALTKQGISPDTSVDVLGAQATVAHAAFYDGAGYLVATVPPLDGFQLDLMLEDTVLGGVEGDGVISNEVGLLGGATMELSDDAVHVINRTLRTHESAEGSIAAHLQGSEDVLRALSAEEEVFLRLDLVYRLRSQGTVSSGDSL